VIFVKQVVVAYIITFSEQHVTWESDCAWVITFDEVNACGMYKVGSLDDEISNTM
jgi:hypothetical protein